MLLNQTTYFIKEQVGFAKLTGTYEILDPATQQNLGLAKEEPPGWAKWLRLLVNKQMLPTTVNVYESGGPTPLFSIHRPFTFFRSKVQVTSGDGQQIGYFKGKVFSFGGGFYVYDNADKQVAEVKGDWKGWNFKFVSGEGREIGTVTKKWAGIGKELFTSADNYIISLSKDEHHAAANVLLLAAGLAIDLVFKEKQ